MGAFEQGTMPIREKRLKWRDAVRRLFQRDVAVVARQVDGERHLERANPNKFMSEEKNNLSRRDLLKAISFGLLATTICPAQIPLAPKKEKIILYGDGSRDDTDALNAWGSGEEVFFPDGSAVGNEILERIFVTSATVFVTRERFFFSHCIIVYNPNLKGFVFSCVKRHPDNFFGAVLVNNLDEVKPQEIVQEYLKRLRG